MPLCGATKDENYSIFGLKVLYGILAVEIIAGLLFFT